MIEINKLANETIEHCPTILTGVSVIGTIVSAMVNVKHYDNPLLMYRLTGDEHYYIKYLRRTKSNNWLRMHGYAMRKRKRN